MTAAKLPALTKIVAKFAGLPWYLQWLLASVLSLCLYFPILTNSFVSDDFLVIKKVVADRQLNTDGFFRPLSDITIFLNYLVGGLHPFVYYLTGILLHALSGVLLLRLCVRWQWAATKQRQQAFALLAMLLFMTYPFHNEAVAWILGRGALMANTLGLAALLILVGRAGEGRKIAGVCACYFIGLTAYETIIVLPVLIIVYLWFTKAGSRSLLKWTVALLLATVVHVIVRIIVSGYFFGNYGEGFFNNTITGYVVQGVKAFGRVLLPPLDQPGVLIAAASVLFVALCFLTNRALKKVRDTAGAKTFFYTVAVFFIVAMIIPAVAAVSTRTSESDRFLHFPSFFYCMLLAFILINLFRYTQWLVVITLLITGYHIYFLEKNNQNWQKASAAVTEILYSVTSSSGKQGVYVVNLPGEIDGAFVFRRGFKEALQLNGANDRAIVVVNQLTRDDELQLPDTIAAVQQPDGIFIPPFALVKIASQRQNVSTVDSNKVQVSVLVSDKIIYWNKKNWVQW